MHIYIEFYRLLNYRISRRYLFPKVFFELTFILFGLLSFPLEHRYNSDDNSTFFLSQVHFSSFLLELWLPHLNYFPKKIVCFPWFPRFRFFQFSLRLRTRFLNIFFIRITEFRNIFGNEEYKNGLRQILSLSLISCRTNKSIISIELPGIVRTSNFVFSRSILTYPLLQYELPLNCLAHYKRQ